MAMVPSMQYVDPSQVGPNWAPDVNTAIGPGARPGQTFPGTYQLVRVSGDDGTWPIKLRVPRGFSISGKAVYKVRDGRFLLTVCLCHAASKSKLCVTGDVALAPIQRWVEQSAKKGVIEVGWNPFDTFRNIGHKIESGWNSVTKVAKKIASSEAVKRVADIVGFPGLGEAINKAANLPDKVKAKANVVLKQAETGIKTAKDKVANITQQAAGGNNAAMALWAYMSSMFRGGMPSPSGPMGIFSQMMPQVMAYPRMPSSLPFGLPWPVPFQTSTPKVSGMDMYDMPVEIGGWLFSMPYRSNLKAGEIDKSNPRHVLRALYHDGLRHRPKKIKWPNW